jgi:hypothetical protein
MGWIQPLAEDQFIAHTEFATKILFAILQPDFDLVTALKKLQYA